MENKEIVQKEVTKAKRIINLTFLVIKALFLISGAIFFAHIIIEATLIQVPLGSKVSSYNRIGSEPQFIVLVDVARSAESEKVLLQIVHYLFTAFTIIIFGIFVSPFAFILKDVIKEITKDFFGFFGARDTTIKESANQINISKSYRYKLLKITGFLFSVKTQKDVFSPTMSDWDEEIFEAEEQKKIWKARWISLCYTYVFLKTMLMKSPIDDLIKFIKKIAK